MFRRFTISYDVLRIFVAMLLLTASALKCWQLATEPIVGDGLLDSRWLLMATVEGELLFGLWLLADVWAKPTWAVVLACFGLFTCVSFCKALSGYASCGCFGRVVVNPWYTSGLDLAVMASLLRWRPKESCFTIQRATAVLVVWLSVGVPAALAMGSYSPNTLSDGGDIIGDGKIVVLEPEKWIGKLFPLLPFIEDDPKQFQSHKRPLQEQLAEGNWLVVLYHHDCPKCKDAMPKYEDLVRRSVTDPMAPRIALIEIPPYDDRLELSRASDTECFLGQLRNDIKWFVVSPAEINLTDSIVDR